MTHGGLSGQRALSTELATLGPFFAVETHAQDQSMPPPWQPMTALIADTEPLTSRVDAVRTALARRAGQQPDDVEIRVAASVTHLGLIARLLAPAIGAVTLGQSPISLRLDDLWWQNQLDGPYSLSVARGSMLEVRGRGSAVEAITTVIAERYRMSRRVLWGNIGSATNSAARLISVARPHLSIRAHRTADGILTDPRIDGGALRAGPMFRRRSCCLIYRIGGDDRNATCGDCVLIDSEPANQQ